MRYAILADIHGNLVAFKAVLQDIEKRGGFDKIWCLGDVVGYGPEPHACIGLLQQYDHICIAGNHDWAAIDLIDTLDFNEDAALANQWTAQQLTGEDKDYLKSLPQITSEQQFQPGTWQPQRTALGISVLDQSGRREPGIFQAHDFVWWDILTFP